jgi:hypothetical protein
MKKTTLLANGVIAFSMLGCAMAQSPVNGFLYSDVKHPGVATEAYGGSARGEACATSILGLIANGDASIDSAKKNGMVMQVTAVDHSSSNILGFYAKYCTIVYGKKGTGASAPAKSSGGGEG